MKRIGDVINAINEFGIDASVNIAGGVINLNAKLMARYWQHTADPEKVIRRLMTEFINCPFEYGFNNDYHIIMDEAEANTILTSRIPTLAPIFHTSWNPDQHTKYFVCKSDEEADVEFSIPVVYRPGPNGKGIAIMAFATRGNSGVEGLPDDSESINLLPSDVIFEYLSHIAKLKFCDAYSYAVKKSSVEYYENVGYEVKDSWTIPNPDHTPDSEESFKGLNGAESLLNFMRSHNLIEGPDDEMHIVGIDKYTFSINTFKDMLESDHDFRNIVFGIAKPYLDKATAEAQKTEDAGADSNDVEASAPESYFNNPDNE